MSEEGIEVYDNQDDAQEETRAPRSTSEADNVEDSSQASTGKISKRKRSNDSDDEEDTNLETKKPKSEVNASSEPVHVTVISQTEDTMVVEIPHDKVGSIIGTKGMIIQDIQARSGCQAKVNQDFPPGVPRQMEFRGTKATMAAGLDLVKRILEFGPASIHSNTMFGGPQITTTMDCPITIVGKVIGTGGQTIKEIQSKSGAKVQIHQDLPPEQPRKLEITGSASAVGSAVQMIQTIMTGGNINGPTTTPRGNAGPATQHNGFGQQQGHTPRVSHHHQPQQQFHHHHHNPPPVATAAPPTAPMYHPPATAGPEVRQQDISIVIEVSKMLVGKIIGKGGENIVSLQRKSGCRIVVDQQVPEGYPCRVNVTGVPYNVDLARKLIEEIQMGVHTSKLGATLPPPVAAGTPAPAAPPAAPQAVYGGYSMPAYGMPPAAQPPVYNAYGAYPAAPPAVASYSYAQPATATAPNPYAYPAYSHHAAAPVAQPYQKHHATTPRVAAAPVAKPAPAPQPAASVWTEYKDDEGRSYWYNSATGVSQWEPPSYKK